ncbi:MAG: hypothetical protein LKF61_05100 [Eggerthellaceae bacterium]|nr:hypothetical protein [Eggerthellaceae bacterium]MCH4220533.1 hypothetical protein [Eggerthellaceae bacterium]
MNESFTRSHMKLWVALAAVLLAVACCFAVTPKAYASGVDWNNNVTVDATANPYDATASGTERNQTINVVMTFSAALPSSISSDDAQSYLQSHTTIAGRALSGTYNRAITNVSVNGNEIAFTVGPNTAGMTAIYSGEFEVTADADANSAFASAMGGQPVETLINTGLGITCISAGNDTVTYQVTSLPKCRAMNFVIFQLNGEDATGNILANGTCANGAGITAHSHMFYSQDAANYAEKICTAATNTTSDYTFTAGSNGFFTISGPDAQDIYATVYNGTYLNTVHEAVGTTSETIIVDPTDPRI